MSNRAVVLALAVMAGSGACHRPDAGLAVADSVAVYRAIEDIQVKAAAWDLHGEAGPLVATYTEDAVRYQADGPPLRGRAAIDSAFRLPPPYVAEKSRETIDYLRVTPGFAAAIGTWAIAGRSRADGTPLFQEGQFMVLMRPDTDGVWRMYKDMYTQQTTKEPHPLVR